MGLKLEMALLRRCVSCSRLRPGSNDLVSTSSQSCLDHRLLSMLLLGSVSTDPLDQAAREPLCYSRLVARSQEQLSFSLLAHQKQRSPARLWRSRDKSSQSAADSVRSSGCSRDPCLTLASYNQLPLWAAGASLFSSCSL